MLNRKENKVTNGVGKHGSGQGRNAAPAKARRHLRRFIISSKAPGRPRSKAEENRNGLNKVSPTKVGPAKVTPTKVSSASQVKAAYAGRHAASPPGAPAHPIDLGETIKTLLHL